MSLFRSWSSEITVWSRCYFQIKYIRDVITLLLLLITHISNIIQIQYYLQVFIGLQMLFDTWLCDSLFVVLVLRSSKGLSTADMTWSVHRIGELPASALSCAFHVADTLCTQFDKVAGTWETCPNDLITGIWINVDIRYVTSLCLLSSCCAHARDYQQQTWTWSVHRKDDQVDSVFRVILCLLLCPVRQVDKVVPSKGDM